MVNTICDIDCPLTTKYFIKERFDKIMFNLIEKAKLAGLTAMTGLAGLSGAALTASSTVSAEGFSGQLAPAQFNNVDRIVYTVGGFTGKYQDFFNTMKINGKWVFCTEPNVLTGGNYTAPVEILKTNVVVRTNENGGTKTPSDEEKIQAIGMLWAAMEADPDLLDQVQQEIGAKNGEAGWTAGEFVRNLRSLPETVQYGVIQLTAWQIFAGNAVSIVSGESGATAQEAWNWINGNGHSSPELRAQGFPRMTDFHWVGNMVRDAWKAGVLEYNHDAYFLTSDEDKQRLLTTTGTFKLSNGKVEMQKVSSNPQATNGNSNYSLEGAEYELKNATASYKLVTDKNGKASLNKVRSGEYILKEVKAPKGYELNSQEYTVSVKSGQTTVIEAEKTTDKPVLGSVELHKISGNSAMTNGNSNYTLKGAVYELTSKEGRKYTLTTDDNGYAKVEGIVLGDYVLKETKAPKGFAVSGETENVSIKNAETVNIEGSALVKDKPTTTPKLKLATKSDSELTGGKLFHGDASVVGAEFEVRFYNKVNMTKKDVESEKPRSVVKGIVNEKGEMELSGVNGDAYRSNGGYLMPIGAYSIVETKAPKGYNLNKEVFVYNVMDDASDTTTETETATGNAETAQVKEQVIRGGVQVIKSDKELGKSEAIGGAKHEAGSKDGADLNGVTFEIKNASAKEVMVDGKVYQPGEVVKTIATSWNKEVGAYTAQTDAKALPYGTYSIKEVASNESYLLSDKAERVFQIREEGKIVNAATDGTPLNFVNQIIRGEFKFNKIVDGTSERLSTGFIIKNVTTGEKHLIVTDKNGEFSSNGNKHSADVNANDSFIAKAEAGESINMKDLNMKSGVWFGNAEDGSVANVNDGLGALPYGKYTISEIRTDTNEGLKLQKFDYYISKEGKTVDLGTVTDDRETPEIGTTLTDTVTKEHIAFPDKKVKLVDKVSYKNLRKGKEYTVTGVLMDKSTGGKVIVGGKEVTASTKFTAEKSNGSVDVTFEFDATGLEGTSVVAFEDVYEGNLKVGTHADINDEGQTVEIPKVRTTLVDSKTKDHVSKAEQKVTLIDTVKYEKLIVGKEYTVSGELMDKATGKSIGVKGSTKFKAEKPNGSVDIKFEFDASKLEGKSVVAFEDVSYNGIKVGTHADINDEEQTVNFPKAGTTLVDSKTRDHVSVAEKEVTLVDTVKYENLTPGKEYTVKGELMDKATKKSIGAKAETTFVASAKNGTVDVTFKFDGSKLAGTSVVAFESVYHKGAEIAVHADINDEGQTVDFPKVGTTLIDSATKSHEALAAEKTKLVDTVKYENLKVGKEYTVSGVLMNKENGQPILNADGSQIVASTKFKAEKPNGTVDVVFEFDARAIAGKSVVAFENVSKEGVVIATHSDINDKEQTVDFPKVGTTLTDSKTKDHVANAEEKVTLIDKVEYHNLIVGKEYTVKGELMDKATGKSIDVKAETKFKADKADGSVDLKFEFDASKLAGKSVVAFENVYNGKELVAVHADINDKGQTVDFPSLGTSLTSKVDGSKKLTPSEKTVLVDKVQYTGLIVGKEYTVKGELMDKETGKSIGVKGETKFKAEKADGFVEVVFEFDSSKLAGKSVVAFEEMYQGEILVGTHKDINDEGQTVTFEKPEKPEKPTTPSSSTPSNPRNSNTPNTGVGGANYVLYGGIALALAIVAGVATVVYKRQNKKAE